MDTSQFSNILKAVGQTPAPASPAPSLSWEQQSENYNIYSELTKKGVYIPDLLKRLDDLESKVREMESQPKRDTNAEILAVMEQAVRNHPDVKASRQHVADVKSTIITEMCMKDPRYKQALEDYKTMVNKVYIQTRESDGRPSERTPCPEVQATDGGGAAEICDHPGGCGEDQEGVPSGQKAE